MAMNYANLGFAQVDFTGVDLSLATAQQGVIGNYSKCIEAINNEKIIVGVNRYYDTTKMSTAVLHGSDEGDYINLSDGGTDYHIYPNDEIQVA